jgi:hypothetical protein
MFKRVILFFLIFMTGSSLYAQRKGAVDTGGMFSFKSYSEKDSSGSELDFQWIVGYYMSRKLASEFQPIISVNFQNDNVNVSSILMGGFSYRLFDVVPDDYMQRRQRGRELGTAPGVYATGLVGFWVDGFTQKDDPSGKTYSGPVISGGLGTRTGISKTALLRVNAQMIYLMPNGPVYDSPRTIFLITVGLSVFVVL